MSAQENSDLRSSDVSRAIGTSPGGGSSNGKPPRKVSEPRRQGTTDSQQSEHGAYLQRDSHQSGNGGRGRGGRYGNRMSSNAGRKNLHETKKYYVTIFTKSDFIPAFLGANNKNIRKETEVAV